MSIDDVSLVKLMVVRGIWKRTPAPATPASVWVVGGTSLQLNGLFVDMLCSIRVNRDARTTVCF